MNDNDPPPTAKVHLKFPLLEHTTCHWKGIRLVKGVSDIGTLTSISTASHSEVEQRTNSRQHTTYQ
jgi:FtsP/CotA-like multicopper oxidase with cupredoxin domain